MSETKVYCRNPSASFPITDAKLIKIRESIVKVEKAPSGKVDLSMAPAVLALTMQEFECLVNSLRDIHVNWVKESEECAKAEQVQRNIQKIVKSGTFVIDINEMGAIRGIPLVARVANIAVSSAELHYLAHIGCTSPSSSNDIKDMLSTYHAKRNR